MRHADLVQVPHRRGDLPRHAARMLLAEVVRLEQAVHQAAALAELGHEYLAGRTGTSQADAMGT